MNGVAILSELTQARLPGSMRLSETLLYATEHPRPLKGFPNAPRFALIVQHLCCDVSVAKRMRRAGAFCVIQRACFVEFSPSYVQILYCGGQRVPASCTALFPTFRSRRRNDHFGGFRQARKRNSLLQMLRAWHREFSLQDSRKHNLR